MPPRRNKKGRRQTVTSEAWAFVFGATFLTPNIVANRRNSFYAALTVQLIGSSQSMEPVVVNVTMVITFSTHEAQFSPAENA